MRGSNSFQYPATPLILEMKSRALISDGAEQDVQKTTCPHSRHVRQCTNASIHSSYASTIRRHHVRDPSSQDRSV